jgi:hypothetical protein
MKLLAAERPSRSCGLDHRYLSALNDQSVPQID